MFTLTALGLAIVYSGEKVLGFWSIFAYIIALSCTYAFLVQPLLAGERKLSGKKIVLLTFSVTMLGAIVTHSVWTIITPRWSFSVTTDESTYRLGDDVNITVCLKNLGFITHSFESRVNDPVVVGVKHQYTENPTITSQVWYSSYHINITPFSIRPNESLERNFIWNQTNLYLPEREIKPGTYFIEAFVPSAESTMPVSVDTLFWVWTSINITSGYVD